MTLTNYWWLLIWLAIGGVFCNYAFPKEQILVNGKIETRWSMSAAILLAVPYIIWTATRSRWFGDTNAYWQGFLNSPTLRELPGTIDADTKDAGFAVLNSIIKSIIGNSPIIYFLIIAAFQMICLVVVYRKYSTDYLMCIFLFVASTDYLSWMFNGMRQFIAAAAIFACFGLIVKKKYIPLILIILLCSTIHASALLMLPLVFIIQGKAFNKWTLLFVAGVAIAVVFITPLTPLLDLLLADTQYNDLMTNEIWTNDDGTNVLRVLVYSVPTILALIGKKYVDEANDPIINICVNASACTTILYVLASVSSGIYVGRLPIYTTLMGYIAMPWLLDHMFTKNSARLMKILMVIAYLLFFYYQMHFIWGML